MRRGVNGRLSLTEGSPHHGVFWWATFCAVALSRSSLVVFTVLQVELALVEDTVAVMHGLATEAWSNV